MSSKDFAFSETRKNKILRNLFYVNLAAFIVSSKFTAAGVLIVDINRSCIEITEKKSPKNQTLCDHDSFPKRLFLNWVHFVKDSNLRSYNCHCVKGMN